MKTLKKFLKNNIVRNLFYLCITILILWIVNIVYEFMGTHKELYNPIYYAFGMKLFPFLFAVDVFAIAVEAVFVIINIKVEITTRKILKEDARRIQNGENKK